MKVLDLRAFALAAAVLSLGLTGCSSARLVTIKTLLDDPSYYDHRTVRVAGTVDDSIGVLGYGKYRVDDGTGKLNVVTKSEGAPREGARVDVKGEFRSAFLIGSETAVVLVEKKRQPAR